VAKTAHQIKPLPANSRSGAKRELAPAKSGTKDAEPGIKSKNASRDGRAPKENQKETHHSVPSKCDKTQIQLTRS
jgi:hypothetical protein